MITAIVVLLGICLGLIVYIIILQMQLGRMNHLLDRRLKKSSGQIISIQLVNHQLNDLAANINRCLKQEEQLRLRVMQDETEFKNMIVNISHDLRTPLTAIQGYLQLLQKSSLTSQQQDKLHIAKKHCDELGRLIEHFYEYVYLVDRVPVMNLEKLNLTNLVIENVIASMPAFEEHNLMVHMEERPVYIWADKEMTTRIIQNLIRNCIAHAVKEVTIRIDESCQENEAVLHVINEIPENSQLDVNRLFERFYVADSARKTTGLGLAIVSLLSAQMGKRASAERNGNLLDMQVYFKRYEKENCPLDHL